MAKFRSHHTTSGKKGISFMVKLIIYAVVLLYLLWQLLLYFKKMPSDDLSANTVSQHTTNTSGLKYDIDGSSSSDNNATFSIDLPSQTINSFIVPHKHFTLSYAESHEQAEWVAYELTREELNAPKVGRFDYFAPDLSIKSRSALHRDYTGSGYTRGHLAPAADMAFDQKAAEECFFMSNISPQEKYFNQGIWRELEESVRDWARKNNSLCIVTGPILKSDIIKKIGDNRVSVPSYFYKVLLDTVGNEKKGIGFILPNKKSDLSLENYMVSIDSVEQRTGLDFYNSNSKSASIESLEKSFDHKFWPLNAERFSKRINEWNKQ